MDKITPQMLVESIREWTETVIEFYENYYTDIDDLSFKRLLTTMIDTEKEYISYFTEKSGEIDFDKNFRDDLEYTFKMPVYSITGSGELSKSEFLRSLVTGYTTLVENLNKLSTDSCTDSGKVIFKKLADDKNRQRMILQDRLELEELY